MEKTEDNFCFAGGHLKVCVNLAALEVGKHSVGVLYFALFGSQMRSLCFTCLFCASLPTCALLTFKKVDTGLFCQEKLLVTCTISKNKTVFFY